MSEREISNLIPGRKMVPTPDDYEGPIEYINWNGYKLAVSNAAKLNTEFFDQVKNRLNENRSVIIITTAPPGQGKSWFTERFCEIMDPGFKILDTGYEKYFVDESEASKFQRRKSREGYDCNLDPHPKTGYIVKVNTPPEHLDPSQVVFDRAHFLHLIGNDSPLNRGSTIMGDEAQYAMGARNWYNDLQNDLMESIESVRSRGFIINIVALHLDLLDKIIRKFVLTYMFHIEDRGKATVYRLHTPRFGSQMYKNRLGEIRLMLPDYDACHNHDCLNCEYLYVGPRSRTRCMTIRAKYERRKKEFTGRRSKQAQEKILAQKEETIVYSVDDYNEVILNHIDGAGETAWTHNRINPSWIGKIVKETLDVELGINAMKQKRNDFEVYYPEKAKRDD